MGGRREAVSTLVATVLLAGCAVSTDGPVEPAAAALEQRPVVIAVIDSGITPYYEIFRAPDATSIPAALAISPATADFPLEGAPDVIERDLAIWQGLETGVLYQFNGTRVLGISFENDSDFEPVRDASFHGVATAYLAAREAPDAVILSVQVGLGTCPDQNCSIIPYAADAMEWVAAQPWIDIVTVSLGIPGSAPDSGALHPDVSRYVAATRSASASGKLMLNAAGNLPTPPVQGHFNGPPWIITVGGFSAANQGESILAAKSVDVVANFTDYTAMYGDGDMAWRSGTSFSTPIVAGTLANALHKVRQAQPGRVVTPQELRDALNASATYVSPTDWRPTASPHNPLLDGGEFEAATLPIVAQAQMGWGYVDASLADEIARRVLENDFSVPSGKEQAMLFQPRWQQARETFWDAYG